jgi:hypothetical protein
MATRKTGRKLATSRSRAAAAKPASEQKPVALTLKVDSQTYKRLRILGATQLRTNQDILQEALQEYLERAKA